jgi:hypothetical protein
MAVLSKFVKFDTDPYYKPRKSKYQSPLFLKYKAQKLMELGLPQEHVEKSSLEDFFEELPAKLKGLSIEEIKAYITSRGFKYEIEIGKDGLPRFNFYDV